MTNHYHALVHDEHGLLYGTDGSLMRGRYRSRVVQSEGYMVKGRRLAVLDVEEVISVACESLGVARQELLTARRGTRNIPRSLTMLLCRELTSATGRALGAIFGVHPSTVSWTAKKAAVLAAEEPEVSMLLERMREKLGR